KAGTFTQTQRLVQWRHKAVDPPGDAQSELDFFFELGQRIREKLADSDDPRDRPLLDLTWNYPIDEAGEVDAEAVLAEINGYFKSEEHTSELQSRFDLVCRLLLEKKKGIVGDRRTVLEFVRGEVGE